MSKVQDDEVGDGTTSVTVLAAELLRVTAQLLSILNKLRVLKQTRLVRAAALYTTLLLLQEAELLIAKKIHPQTIISGWRKATQAARDALREVAVDHR